MLQLSHGKLGNQIPVQFLIKRCERKADIVVPEKIGGFCSRSANDRQLFSQRKTILC